MSTPLLLKAVTPDNLEKEHICCAIAAKKNDVTVLSKKQWLQEAFKDGLQFHKLDARGKVFIEFMPAESAWAPIHAPNYLYINCFWVSGSFKNQGYANALLDRCLSEAKRLGKSGLVVLSSTKKMPFLSDPKYLKYKGFLVADTAKPYYELLYYPLEKEAPHHKPAFLTSCQSDTLIDPSLQKGYVLYYSHQCPHTAKYVPLLEAVAQIHDTPLKTIRFTSASEAQAGPNPFSTYSLYYNGQFVTNEILSDTKFEKMLSEMRD